MRAAGQQPADVELGGTGRGQAPVDEGQAPGPVGLEGHVHGREVTVQEGRRQGQAGRREGCGVLGQGEHPLAHLARRDLRPVLPPAQGVVHEGRAGVRPDPPRLEQALDGVERGQPVRRRAEERCVQVGDGTEHRPGLLSGDDGLPVEHGVPEVTHDQHAEPVVVVPAVDDRMQHRRRQAVEDASPEEVHLASAGVAGEPHDQVDGRVEALDDHPGAVGEEDTLQRRSGTSVVVDRGAVEGGVEHRAIHGPIMLAGPGWRSTRLGQNDAAPDAPRVGREDLKSVS